MTATISLTHRKDIDGLRGLAVGMVILFHARIPGFEWGYLGVDIFFVISGYLITRLITSELHTNGRFSFWQFYQRRAFRILPALVAMLAVTIPFAIWSLPPQRLQTYGISMASAAVFATNFYYIRHGTGYFEINGDGDALVHLWSLSVEEQFYLGFPILLAVLYKFLPKKIWLVMAVFALMSLFLRLGLHQDHPGASFYIAPTRFWELLAGAMAATLPPAILAHSKRYPLWLAIIVVALLAAIPVSHWLLKPSGIIDPLFSVAAVMFAAIFLAAPSDRSPVSSMLQSRPFVALGLISYSAYLWHMPLLVFARSLTLRPLTFSELGALFVLLMGIAWASWYWIEQPFRRIRVKKKSDFIRWVGIVSFFMLASGALIAASARFSISAPMRTLGLETKKGFDRIQGCASVGAAKPLNKPCAVGSSTAPVIAVVGDSHASALAGGSSNFALNRGYRVEEFSRPACLPVLPTNGLSKFYAQCAVFNKKVLAELSKMPSVKIVVLAARWPGYIEGSTFDNGQPGGKEYGQPAERIERAVAVAGIQALVSAIEEQGKQVVLVYPVPEAGWYVPDRLLKRHKHSWLKDAVMTVPLETIESRLSGSRAMLDDVKLSSNSRRVDPLPLFCDRASSLCYQSEGLISWYMDDDHLNPTGAEKIWVVIAQKIAVR